MIGKIWSKLFLMVLLVVVPLMAAQYYMQREAITLVSNIAEKGNPAEFMDSHLESLKKLSRLDPANLDSYRAEFERAVEHKTVTADLALVKRTLIDDILAQTLRNTLLVLLVALGITYGIARSIVALLRRLIKENQKHSLRLERLSALESWKKVARMMVHEMRAPITPIKLVATDVEAKYRDLAPEVFQNYLRKGTELILMQVAAMERLTENLTRFAKLPDVQKQPGSINEFLQQFADTYKDYGAKPPSVQVDFEREERPMAFDAALLSLLFFNLLKNAVEANPKEHVQVQLRCRQFPERTCIAFANAGGSIPEKLAGDIFKMHVSSKGESGSNFGVGLTIAKKIALDHNGDLSLTRNNAEGVAFELELPNA